MTQDENRPDEKPAPPGGQSASKVEQDPLPSVDIPGDVEIEKISGAFSSQTVSKVGTGTTQRKAVQKAFWYAEEGEPDAEGNRLVLVQPLNNNNVPSGPKESVPLVDFLERYNPEIEYYQEHVFPRIKEMNSTLKRAEAQREQGALYSAQFEFEAALSFDEKNVRANFGLGLTYMERGESEKAGDIFERLVSLDAAFSPEHKHLFNEFGINLRKSKLLDQAVDYYSRALEITEDDDNLYYNVARAYFERGDLDECRESLRKALALNPTHEAATKFMAYLDKDA
ncbi:tetratricopeptide repeat protein [Pseudodesulfovibrio sediminis]|uniref:Tetratricopeptide repeat protein n=1 Tax=Pseudodesulfovibrio sediminis TaxID=2810563 RepID=A0ABN6EWQ3_9BACT|nr:tetratricopeptide repeat protein [Pseudodesulfovibrio sediminis]BCS89456.1 hypothetical protein PSDVSF_26980 [Pseudodesulfovibrio sediminis]